MSEFMCPVCGYFGLDEPAYDKNGLWSFEICICCGVQYGYTDCNTSHAELRARWIANGMKWHSRVFAPPENWDPVEQLRRAGFAEEA